MAPARHLREFLILSFLVLCPAATSAQRQDAEIPGELAWEQARINGFEFYPEALIGETVSSPRDGDHTSLTKIMKGTLGTQTIRIAHVLGGRSFVMSDQRLVTFTLFGSRTLGNGWTVKSVEVSGNFTYVSQPQASTEDLKFRIQVKPGGSATVNKIVLNGPLGGHWEEAFRPTSGGTPATATAVRNYVVSGTDAWNAARKRGFTFRPILRGTAIAGSTADGLRIIGAPDGIATSLEVSRENRRECAPGSPGFCIIGVVTNGQMGVAKPDQDNQENKVAFEMFGTRKLASGWTVSSVSVSNGVFQKQAGAGTSDLSFVLVLTSKLNQASSAVIQSITLTGPANAANFEDAFR